MPLSDRVRTLRTNKGLSQEALAGRTGLSRATIIRIEGGHMPRVMALNLIAAELGCSLVDLLDDIPTEVAS